MDTYGREALRPQLPGGALLKTVKEITGKDAPFISGTGRGWCIPNA